MKIIILYSLMVAHSLLLQTPLFSQTDYTAKVKVEKEVYFTHPVTTVITFSGTINNDRVLLDWIIDENQAVDKIEVERSTDQKNFIMAGLVFGTDLPDQAKYLFYEKSKKGKLFYRLKIVNKDLSIVYSPVIVPQPATDKH